MQKLVLKSSKSLMGDQANLKQGQQIECHAYTEGKFLLLKVSLRALQVGDIVFSIHVIIGRLKRRQFL